ncbi:hypothetical protein Tsubulata_011008 [Turnera subulata]|uniref:Uncharacterized protein n=1 Tax=Turnera subulata TaxID=218843 RepID=A0A9Q0JK45_9ROSI|nr:hypothetical protein Tsubulata_011008 [Turnera subulata]
MEPEEQKTRLKRGHLLQSVDNQHQGLELQIKKMKLGEDWALESLPRGQNAIFWRRHFDRNLSARLEKP